MIVPVSESWESPEDVEDLLPAERSVFLDVVEMLEAEREDGSIFVESSDLSEDEGKRYQRRVDRTLQLLSQYDEIGVEIYREGNRGRIYDIEDYELNDSVENLMDRAEELLEVSE